VRLEQGAMVTAHICGPGRNFVRILIGDRVRVELSPAIGAGTDSREDCRAANARFENQTRSRIRHEGQSVGQADLRQVQGRARAGRGARDLSEPEAQAAAGIETYGTYCRRRSSADQARRDRLTYIYGIGRVRSNIILKDAGVSRDIRVKDLSEDDVRKISRVIEEQGASKATSARRSR
jgi:predicted flap endonuclease-1-like 5' DNA nuclease